MSIEYVEAKTILQRSKKSYCWFASDYNVNLYRGCSHGCIYCDSRSECYGVEQFDKVKLKRNAIEILTKELQAKQKTGIISMGAMSDPYNPLEKDLLITQQALKLFYRYGFGTAIFSKSNLILRDIDLLKKIHFENACLCGITITTFDDSLSKKIEPNVPASSQRFDVIKQLSDAGIFVGVIFMPMLPFITDTIENIQSIVYKAKTAGAKFVYPMFGVTLRNNQRDHYYKKLDILFPELKQKYIRFYHNKYLCDSPKRKILQTEFYKECNKNNLLFETEKINAEIKKIMQPYKTLLF